MSRKQDIYGDAYEYACFSAICDWLKNNKKAYTIDCCVSIKRIETAFNSLNKDEREAFICNAKHLITSLFNYIENKEPFIGVLTLSVQSDDAGKKGDVRDIIILKTKESHADLELGFSIKHNNDVVKNSRLSRKADVINVWSGGVVKSSLEYMNGVKILFENPTFNQYKKDKKRWDEILSHKWSMYKIALDLFKSELRLISNNPEAIKGIFLYLLGRKDYYKIIGGDKGINRIEVFNVNGTLPGSNLLLLPTKIESMNIKQQSDDDGENTLLVKFDNGWALSFRLHNGSSKVEYSFKFDVKITQYPETMEYVDII